MSRKHDPKAAENLIDHVIKDEHLREQLKRKAREEEEQFAAAQQKGDSADDPTENLPV